jgi:hypothetical protein
MAIIYTYPIKATPIDTDLVLITDSESEDPADATKQVSIASIKGAGSGPGSGTQYTLPMWGTISTLADSMVKQNAAANELTLASGASDKIIIPEYIHHLSDANSYFGFPTNDGWRLVTGGLDKIGVVGSRAILYHTSTIAEPKLETTSSGIKIVGSASELGGKIQFNSANGTTNVALAGPANTGTSYTLRFPNAIGGNGQILALPASVTGVDETLVWKDESTGGPGTGAEGRVAYWTTSADPGILGDAPIKYTPASAGPPVVEELTEIISNSATHKIKIGTEASAGQLTLGSLTNNGTQVFSGGTLQLYSAGNDGAVVQGGILADISTTSRSGTINILNRNNGTGAITSSVNIGLAQNSASVSDAVNIHKPLYSHQDTFCVGSSGSTQFNVGYDESAGSNFANQRFTVNSATATTQLKLRGRTLDGSSILDLTNFDTYGALGFNGNSATGSQLYINNVTNQLSTLNFGGPNNDQMVLYVNNTKTENPPSTTNGGVKIAGSLQLLGQYAIKAGTSAWQTGSDERYKENIIDADLDICYNNIKKLKLKRFNYKEEVFRDPASDNTKLGFIAQEVNEIFPKSVVSAPFTTWVNYGGDSEILGSDGETKIKPGDRVQDVLAGSVVVDDFKTMNEEQILRSMYGAFKKMQEKIESLEAKVKVLEG